MTTQPPVRFENYPPEDTASAAGAPGAHSPVVRPYVPATIPPPTPGGTNRRTLIGLVTGIPVAVILLSVFANGSTDTDEDEYPPDDVEYTEDPEDTDAEPTQLDFSVGRYSASVPDGWMVNDDDSGAVEVTNGANRLTAVSIEIATGSLAVEEIARISKPRYSGFSGKMGDPVDRSSATLQHATMDGAGKFKGKVARLMVELWIDEEGSGLLVTRVITAKVSSAIAVEAQEMLEQLSGEF